MNYIKKYKLFESIRSKYQQYGVDKYYQYHSNEYKNPHIKQIQYSLDKIKVDLSSVLDLSCGGGEVTSYLVKKGYNNIIGSDPYTCDLYKKNTNKKCLKLSFDDILSGKLDKKFSTIICSFALHLCKESKINTLLYQLSSICDYLVVISPNKKPNIDKSYFELVENFEIERVKTRVYKSKISKWRR